MISGFWSMVQGFKEKDEGGRIKDESELFLVCSLWFPVLPLK
jgi:hypothetical protein